ncbi:MAG: hypothetical protein AAGD14_00775 [Planctomycetota bacterium]
MRVTWPLLLLPLLVLGCGSPATQTGAGVEEDGSYIEAFAAERDRVFEAAVQAAREVGYRTDVVDPTGGRISGQTEPTRRGIGVNVQYYILRADVLPPTSGLAESRLRVVITYTYHLSGQSRTSINDKIVGAREKYDAYFKAVRRHLNG